MAQQGVTPHSPQNDASHYVRAARGGRYDPNKPQTPFDKMPSLEQHMLRGGSAIQKGIEGAGSAIIGGLGKIGSAVASHFPKAPMSSKHSRYR